MPDFDDAITPSRAATDPFADGPRDPLRRQGTGGIPGETRPALRDDFRVAAEHYGATLGPMVGFGFILWGINIALGFFPYLGGCLQFVGYVFATFAFQAGYVFVSLRQMRGQEWNFGDLFAGFRWWTPLFLNHLLNVALLLVCFVPGYALMIAGFVFAVFTPAFAPPPPNPGAAPPPPPNVLLALWPVYVGAAVLVLGVLPYTYGYVRLFALSPFLIIDRGMGPMEAVKANWAATRTQPWGWLRVGLVLLLVCAVGAVPCGIGSPFVVQLWYLTFAAAYLRMTGDRQLEGPL